MSPICWTSSGRCLSLRGRQAVRGRVRVSAGTPGRRESEEVALSLATSRGAATRTSGDSSKCSRTQVSTRPQPTPRCTPSSRLCWALPSKREPGVWTAARNSSSSSTSSWRVETPREGTWRMEQTDPTYVMSSAITDASSCSTSGIRVCLPSTTRWRPPTITSVTSAAAAA